MNQSAKALILALVVLGLAASGWSEWAPVEGKIMTRWAKEVSPANALPEYPRPTMTREAWDNLNGLWEYAITARDAERPAEFDGQILVPYPIESALSGVGETVTPNQRLWYRRAFSVPTEWRSQRLLIHFEAVDWEAQVWVNGRQVGEHRGGFDPFSFDITGYLVDGEEQEIVVAVWDPTDRGTQPRGKQILRPHGIWYTAVTGIWGTVWLEPAPQVFINDLRLVPDVDENCLWATVRAFGPAEQATVRAVATRDGNAATDGVVTGAVNQAFKIPLKDKAELWSPDSPTLYDLTISLTNSDGTEVYDEVGSYFGMRKIAVDKDADGIQRLFLNNEVLFQYGPLDQGWWPDGLYTPPTDDAMRYDVQVTKDLGFNMLRKHVKIEPRRFYYWCDVLGVMVWQDMPSSSLTARGEGDTRTPESATQFELELKRMIDSFYNHPSIVMWVPFNEGWGQYDTVRITNWNMEYDPSRLVNNASGWTDHQVGHVHDIHAYPGPGMPPLEEERAVVLGEFGGLGLPIEGHTWQDRENWGYRSYETQEELTDAYVDLLEKLRFLIGDGLAAAVYTQTTDVEIEVNGMLTYDRAILKKDPERARAAAMRLYQTPPKRVLVVPTSQEQAQTWRYTTTAPAGNWMAPDFDASGWSEGPGGFGTEMTPGTVVRTEWNTSDIWIRRTFTLEEVDFKNLLLNIHHDEDAAVYLNGVRAATLADYTTAYVMAAIAPEAAAALKAGENVIAIHCHQTTGGQYIDAGLSLIVEAE